MSPRMERLNMTADSNTTVRRRRFVQWLLAPVVVITIALGWKYPVLGFAVPVVMIAGMVGGIFRGRYVCGNLCPRGSFFDRVMPKLSLNRRIPEIFRKMAFRRALLVLLIIFMVYRISRDPTDVMHWGHVFWLMCVITTGIGIVLGVFINPRSWCSFCPVGTVQNVLGRGKHSLQIDEELCRECRVCEKACPFGLAIAEFKDDGVMSDPDCLKCSECIAACPQSALSWRSEEEALRPAGKS